MNLPYRHHIIAAITVASSVATLASAPVSHAFSRGMREGVDSAKGTEQMTDLFGATGIFHTITSVLLFAIGAISVIMIIIGGLRYVISGGDASNVSAAKNTILYAVVGLIVALLSYAVINFVLTSFSAGSAGGGAGALDV